MRNLRRASAYAVSYTHLRVTKRRPVGADHSPRWYGWLLIGLLIFGMLVITLNYLDVLPGSTSAWYLVVGLVAMFSAFFLATRYR